MVDLSDTEKLFWYNSSLSVYFRFMNWLLNLTLDIVVWGAILRSSSMSIESMFASMLFSVNIVFVVDVYDWATYTNIFKIMSDPQNNGTYIYRVSLFEHVFKYNTDCVWIHDKNDSLAVLEAMEQLFPWDSHKFWLVLFKMFEY